jgi:hypothetical protein
MKKSKLGRFDVTILDPKIIVFHNALPNPKELIEHYERHTPWKGWFSFGRMVDEQGPILESSKKEFPSYSEWKSIMIDSTPERPVRQEVAESVYWTTKEYVEYTKTKLPNWMCKNWTLARYIPDENIINHAELTMNYHTDYQAMTHDSPGEKFAITAVMYPNDDYEGGEISFRVSNDDYEVVETLEYKPLAGDVVVFPARHPYYHGVRRIWGNSKYIIRTYWQYVSEPSPEWLALREKYGDRFPELEKERMSRHDLMVAEPVLRNGFSITEYYEHLEAGTLPNPVFKGGKA